MSEPAAFGSPPELAFTVERARPLEHAAAPTLVLELLVERVAGAPVRSLALTAQVRIAATRRSYDGRAQERLAALFGPPSQWDRSLRSLPWVLTTVHVPPFAEGTPVELQLPCTYDLEVSAASYLSALDEGDVPLELLFSGTVFYVAGGALQAVRLPWEAEAEFRLPVRVWREVMDRFFPDSAWLRLRRESFDRLHAFRSRRALASWEEAIDELLGAAEERERGPSWTR